MFSIFNMNYKFNVLFLFVIVSMLPTICLAQEYANSVKQAERILQSIEWGSVKVGLPDGGMLSSNKINLDVDVYKNNGFGNMQQKDIFHFKIKDENIVVKGELKANVIYKEKIVKPNSNDVQNIILQKNMLWEWSGIKFEEGLSNISVVIKILIEINGDPAWATLYKKDLLVNNNVSDKPVMFIGLIVSLLLAGSFFYKNRLSSHNKKISPK